MSFIDELLEKACRNMIVTILSCLDIAFKGTIYKIGPMPELRAMRITSGVRQQGSDVIQWGLPSASDYNYPGKTWSQYRDEPGRVLEAMGWCVEKQVSWTAENPFEDVRSVRKQLSGEIEDFYHMEPVLVRKMELYGHCLESLQYPKDFWGNPIWQDSDYVVVAVIKIHFQPYTIRRDDRSTRLIKELSRSLGTELLTLYLRESLYNSQKEFTRQRLQSCEILAHELRNALIKFGFVFSAINAQIAILREDWEMQLQLAFPQLRWKPAILFRLMELLDGPISQLAGSPEILQTAKALSTELHELARLPLLPSQSEQWVKNKILPKWEILLTTSDLWEGHREEIRELLKDLLPALNLGTNDELAEKLVQVPPDLREKWMKLAYTHFTPDKSHLLSEVLELLDHPQLNIAHREQLRKALKSLKVLVDVIPEVEERANRIILSLRYGSLSDDESMAAGFSREACPELFAGENGKEFSFTD